VTDVRPIAELITVLLITFSRIPLFAVKKKPRERVETSASAPPLGGLGPALEKLNVPLSENPSSPAPIPNEPVWKMGRVLLRRETAHRGGKTVVVVYDFATHLPISVIEKVAKKLRAACSTGGTVRDRTIEIQGDQVAKVRATLEAEWFAVGGVR
jgi:translation initiation factor 1